MIGIAELERMPVLEAGACAMLLERGAQPAGAWPAAAPTPADVCEPAGRGGLDSPLQGFHHIYLLTQLQAAACELASMVTP